MTNDAPVLKLNPKSFAGQRIAAVGLITVQALTLGVMTHEPRLAMFVVLLAILSLSSVRKKMMISLPSDRWILFLGALFFVKYSFARQEIDTNYSFLFTDLTFELASFCLLVELLFLYRKQNQEKLPMLMLAFAVSGMIFTGNVRLTDTRRTAMLIFVQVFLIFWAWFALSSRRQQSSSHVPDSRFRAVVMGLVLVVSLTCGATLSLLLHRHEHELEHLLDEYLELSSDGRISIGFSGRGNLSDIQNWKHAEGQKQALKVFSEKSPGYLRGRAFNKFENEQWNTTFSGDRIYRSNSTEMQLKIRDSDGLFSFTDQRSKNLTACEVWPIDRETAGHYFTTLDTVAITCPASSVRIDRSRIVTRTEGDHVSPYTILIDESSHSPSPPPETSQADGAPPRSEFLQRPSQLDSRIVKTAETLFESNPDASEKIRRVENFFRENFQYQMGIKIPREEDRIGYFLENRLPAHCEYFASATAILLRLGNVPTRYVTGYLVQEHNSVDGGWVARRKDAHAWVEAYDDQLKRWVIVESTPSNGIPSASQTSIWEQRKEAISQYLRHLVESARQGYFLSVVWMILEPILWLTAGLAGLAGITMLIQWLFLFIVSTVEREIPASELISERILMDQFITRYGLERSTDETLLRFADRIEQHVGLSSRRAVANWYRTYSQYRFCQRDSVPELKKLRQQRLQIISSHGK